MKIATGIVIGIAGLALPQAAHAAAPKVSGKYAYTSTTACQAIITTTTDGLGKITGVGPTEGGTISSEVGYITFPNTATSSGMASASGKGFEGDAVRIDSAANVAATNNTVSGAFTFNATQFIFAGQTFNMSFGNVVKGVAMSLHMVQKEGTLCISTIHATK
jgi:hypothetical protein